MFQARYVVPFVALAVLALTVGCGGLEEESDDATPAAKSTKVRIFDFKFTPQELTVKEGAKVTWTNDDKADHTVTSDGGEFDQVIKPGGDFSYTFKKKGTFKYQDRLNTQAGLKGSVIVE